MVWNGANYPQEAITDPPDCGHEGVKFHIHDDEGVESISCLDCIAEELETLKQGFMVQLEIQRLTDDEPEYVPHQRED